MAEEVNRILIVEHDPITGDLIGRQSLGKLGYKIKLVGDAGSAIQAATSFRPDVVIANLDGEPVEVDGWLLPSFQLTLTPGVRACLALNPHIYFMIVPSIRLQWAGAALCWRGILRRWQLYSDRGEQGIGANCAPARTSFGLTARDERPTA